MRVARWLLCAGAAWCCACVGNGDELDASAEISTLRVPLQSTDAHGRVFRLSGTVVVTGPEDRSIDVRTDDLDAAEEALTLSLTVGRYSIALTDHALYEGDAVSGTFSLRDDAVPTTPLSIQVDVRASVPATVRFSFSVPLCAASDTSCDGLDDDCDGVVDDDYLPVCTGATETTACQDGSEVSVTCVFGACTPAECGGGCLDGDDNKLRNPGFETVPTPPRFGQAQMPSEWVHVVSSSDIYSNDGSYGLAPGGFSHFIGEMAYEGIRFVAGASFPESFGQLLSTPLIAGASYRLDAALLQDNGPSYNRPGSYEVRLTAGGNAGAVLGTFAPTVSATESWVERTLCFTAPANAVALPWIVFIPVTTSGSSVYPAIDGLELFESCGCD